MKRLTTALVLGLGAVLCVVSLRASLGPAAASPAPPARPTRADRVQARYATGIDSLRAAISALATMPRSDTAAVRAAFRRARRAYKRIEFLIAGRLPDAEIALNGPALPRPHESVVDAVIPPTGLQVIEAALFAPSPAGDSALAVQPSLLAPTLAALRTTRVDPATADSRFFDAVRQEISRVTTLGLAGFDATMSHDGITESAEALRGVREALESYRPENGVTLEAWSALDRRLAEAITTLVDHPDFERFDRLAFIAGPARALADALTRFQAALGVPRTSRPTVWYTNANTIFAPGALDPFDYAPSDAAPPLRPDIVALGRRLFVDSRLSAGHRRACATCHDPARALADGRQTAQVDSGSGPVRNVPTLLNAGLQPFQFADQRAQALEDQIAVVLANPREMNLPLDAAVAGLQTDTGLVTAFATAYGVPRARALTTRRVQTTLAAFVRSLTALRSRFDRAVAGDAAALSAEERLGFNLFMGKAACGTCHFAPTFGGSLPPELLESEPEVIGVPSRPVTLGARIDPDPGVAGFDHVPLHRHAFKTPSLRNVALTAPYMHNGIYRTLDDVVDFYDRGGGAGIGIELSNQTLSAEPLHLSRREKRALGAFMRSLTDTTLSGER